MQFENRLAGPIFTCRILGCGDEEGWAGVEGKKNASLPEFQERGGIKG